MDDKNAEMSDAADKIIDGVKQAMLKMKDPLAEIAISNMDDKAIGDAIKSISDILLELAKNAFAEGVRAGSAATDEAWKASIDTVCRRFYEHVGKEGQ